MRTNDFRAALKSAFEEAERQNLSEIEIDAGELHRKVGGYPGPHHRMPSCCDAIRAEIRLGDLVVHSPPKGKGASLRVRFKLPRIAGRGHIAPMPTGLSDHPPASYASNRAASSRNAEMDLVARTDRTVADKIRALAAEGYRRAEIASLLGKSYQHVRNVLEGDRLRRAPDASEPSTVTPAAETPPTHPVDVLFFRTMLGADGTIKLPETAMREMGVKPGEILLGRWQNSELSLLDANAAARRAQDLVRKSISSSTSLAEELIADRRREAKRENDNG